MYNLIRALVFDEQVSLTLADTTKMVKHGRKIHGLSVPATLVFDKSGIF